MTRPSKTFIFKFFLKIPGCVIEKKLHLRFTKRWRKTWRRFVSIDHLKSLDSCHWAVKEAFADLHRPLRDFRWLSRIDLVVKLRHHAIDSENFPKFPSSPSGRSWKLRQVFSHLTSGRVFSHTFITEFSEKLGLKVFDGPVKSRVYCSMSVVNLITT